MIITIDGPAGTGKSTVAKSVAQSLNITYFDTGAMFRSYAYGLLSEGIDALDISSVVSFVRSKPLTIHRENGSNQYLLNGKDVSAFIRSREVADIASKISVIPEVREELRKQQQKLSVGIDVIFDGRDMGTIVFPKAEVKIFLTASPAVRAERRYKELIEKISPDAQAISYEEIEREIIERDHRDSTRAIAPLKPAADAIIIDTSTLSIDEVVALVIASYRKKAP